MRRSHRTAAAVAASLLLLAGCSGGSPDPEPATASPPAPSPAAEPTVDPPPPPADCAAAEGELPEATTFTVVRGAPLWDDTQWPTQTVTLPQDTAGCAEPGGPALAWVPAQQLGAPGVYPVVETSEGWVRVLIPSRAGLPAEGGPVNGSSLWLPAAATVSGRVSHRATIDLSDRTLTLETAAGEVLRTLPVAIGRPETPTPQGLQYVLSAFSDPAQPFSEVIYGLSTHSETLDTYSGGPATTAIHAHSRTVGEISNGCIRVTAADLPALEVLTRGSPVLVVP